MDETGAIKRVNKESDAAIKEFFDDPSKVSEIFDKLDEKDSKAVICMVGRLRERKLLGDIYSLILDKSLSAEKRAGAAELYILAELDKEKKKLVNNLALSDGDDVFRVALLEQIMAYRVGDEKLLKLVSNTAENPEVRACAVDAIVPSGLGGKKVLDAFVKLLSDKEEIVRMAASSGIGVMCQNGMIKANGDISGKLIKLLKNDESTVVRASAASALGNMGDPKLIPVLKEQSEKYEMDSLVKTEIKTSIQKLEFKSKEDKKEKPMKMSR